ASGLRITLDDGALLDWPYAEIKQTQGAYAGEQVRLERGGEFAEALLIQDSDFLATLHRVAPNRAERFHNPADRPARLRATIVAGVVSIVALIALYLYGVPALATAVTPFVPVAWEEKLGAMVMDQMVQPEKQCNDPVLRKTIDEIVAKLTATVPNSPYKFRVYLVNDPTVNALAAPGGYIVIFRGLLEATRRPEELAGVLAHELQHVLKRHSTKLILQHVSTGVLMSAFFGDVSGLASFGLEAAQTLALLRYSRGHESEADAAGLKMLNAAGIDGSGIISFFEILQAKSGGEPGFLKYVSSHPDTQDRIARLKSLADQTEQAAARPLRYDWANVKKICAARSTR
ncbi:MAG: M48 family metallopeptidase, partial [Deltaproteobacteria bacterium]|nr:M48 family metallopeptidase [Deltaproteobacteria bacterium]